MLTEQCGPSLHQADSPQLHFTCLDCIAPDEPWDGPMQMAVDEVLVRTSSSPTLRFYQWRQKQITFGYFSHYLTTHEKYPSLPLTRRWTGGGVVQHGDDLTFSIAIPASDPVSQIRGSQFYCALHGLIAKILEACGNQARLAGMEDQIPGGECFTAPVAGDVMDADSKKIAGGALRRTKEGILYQGSICGSKTTRTHLQESLPASLATRLKFRKLTVKEILHAKEIELSRYASKNWLLRR